MLGDGLMRRFRIVQHEARRPETLASVGRSARGVPVEMCRAYVDAGIRVVTGFVEPHLFAGYSGGAKGVMPGVAGHEIVMSNHGAENLSHPNARWCITDKNPVFDEMRAVADLCPPHFLLNVTLDSARQITGIFAGEWRAAHDAAIRQAAAQYAVPVSAPYDVVLVTNMGYPADTTLYQSVKGMSVAAEGYREGGAILLVAACEEGVGSDEYVALLTSRPSPADLLAEIQSDRAAAARPVAGAMPGDRPGEGNGVLALEADAGAYGCRPPRVQRRPIADHRRARRPRSRRWPAGVGAGPALRAANRARGRRRARPRLALPREGTLGARQDEAVQRFEVLLRQLEVAVTDHGQQVPLQDDAALVALDSREVG